jgi:hypothetical protein
MLGFLPIHFVLGQGMLHYPCFPMEGIYKAHRSLRLSKRKGVSSQFLGRMKPSNV